MDELLLGAKNGQSASIANLEKKSRKWNSNDFKKYEKFLLDENITSQKLWEIYLKKLESPQREKYLPFDRYDDCCNKQEDTEQKKENENEDDSHLAGFDGDGYDEAQEHEERVIEDVWEKETKKKKGPYYYKYKQDLPDAMDILSELEAKIIKDIFWEGRSELGLARELSITKKKVIVEKERAMRKIKQYLLFIEKERKLWRKRAAA